MKRATRQSLIVCIVMAVFCGLLCLLPSPYLNITSQFPREKVRIDAVDNGMLDAVGIAYNGVQTCQVTVLTGEHRGERLASHNYLNAALDKDKLFAPGDTAWAMLQQGEKGISVTLIDHYRIATELGATAILALALIVFGGMVGCGAMVSLAASAIMIWKLLIPLLLRGINPMLASCVTVVVLTIIIDVLVAGFTKRCLVAVLGSLAGTLMTCFAAILLTHLLKLDGGDLPYVVPLLAQSHMTIDVRSLYIGMVFLANSGALMDLSMDVAVSMEEIHRHKPDISRADLMRSGLIVGRNVLGTMTTTLMLAYSGNYLSMLMYFVGQGTPLGDVVNLKYVASQLLNTLVGSFGLVVAAPLTALVAGTIFFTKPTAPAPHTACEESASS
ncbi:MAG: YibE/F family protein [Christensenellales bacterium]|nr:YibE/F family protein [Christensenellales bacterium]